MGEGVDQLEVEVCGAGPLVVLVHGSAPPTWGTLDAALSADHRVVSYRRRSFAPSPGPTPRSLAGHTDDLVDIIEQFGSGAVLVGWSLGGVIALDLALRRPDLAAGLVLIEPPLHLKARPTVRLTRAVIGAQIRGRTNPSAGARRFLTWALRRSDGTTDLDRLDTADVERVATAVVAELALGTGEKQIKRQSLRTIGSPTVWLVGADSTPEFALAARRAQRDWPALHLDVVPGAGHAIQLDHPDVIATAVRHITRPATTT